MRRIILAMSIALIALLSTSTPAQPAVVQPKKPFAKLSFRRAQEDTVRQMVERAGGDTVLTDLFVKHGRLNDVDPKLLVAIAKYESDLTPRARNRRSGATGLMQVVPSRVWRKYTAACGAPPTRWALTNPDVNICYGTKIYRWFLDHHRGNERRALHAYNNGSGRPNGYARRVYAYLDRLQVTPE